MSKCISFTYCYLQQYVILHNLLFKHYFVTYWTDSSNQADEVLYLNIFTIVCLQLKEVWDASPGQTSHPVLMPHAVHPSPQSAQLLKRLTFSYHCVGVVDILRVCKWTVWHSKRETITSQSFVCKQIISVKSACSSSNSTDKISKFAYLLSCHVFHPYMILYQSIFQQMKQAKK